MNTYLCSILIHSNIHTYISVYTNTYSLIPTYTAPSSSKLFISIRCAGLCIYTLRAFEDLYLSALIEGSVISTDVLQGSYRYFYFKDSHQEQDLVISLTRISGDPDLYIGCAFDPTGDGDGSPSLNHNIASSNDYSTDILHIGAEDASKRCSSGDYYIGRNSYIRTHIHSYIYMNIYSYISS